MANTWTTRQKKDRTKELQENRSVKVEKVVQTEADRERLKRESEAFFKAWGEGMRGGRQ
jgi:hypothetical protein